MFSPTLKSVAGVLSAFQKTLDDLTKVETQHTAEAERQEKAAVDAAAAAQTSRTEAALARTVGVKLANLINNS